MSFSCVPVAMNLPSVLSAAQPAAPGEAARRQGDLARLHTVTPP
jgi:hypothetical protein